MKTLVTDKRSKAIFSITLIAISINAISKKVISCQTKGFIKASQELTLNKGINKFFI